jgi:hypothetical protein
MIDSAILLRKGCHTNRHSLLHADLSVISFDLHPQLSMGAGYRCVLGALA